MKSKNYLKNRRIWSNLGVFLSLILLSGLVFSLFSPVSSTKAASTMTTKFTANIGSVISITAPEDTEYAFGSVTPTEAGVFASKDGVVKVKTNDINGYKLYISANTSETALVSSGTSTTIAACGSGVTSSTMVKDTWGYSVDGTNYNPITTSNVLIASQGTLTQVTEYSHTVNVGMKISSAMQSGTYSNTIKFTAIGN